MAMLTIFQKVSYNTHNMFVKVFYDKCSSTLIGYYIIQLG